MLDVILNFFSDVFGFFINVLICVGIFFGIIAGIFCAALIQSNNSNYSNSDDDDSSSHNTRYIVEATNNTNLGYMQVTSCGSEASAIRAAESYMRNGRDGWRARVVEMSGNKRRGITWTS